METSIISSERPVTLSKVNLNSMFGWMGIGLAITSLISYFIYSNTSLISLLIDERGITLPGLIAMILPIGFLSLMFLKLSRLPNFVLITIFLSYSTAMGISESIVFMSFVNEAVYYCFLSVALMFSAIAITGYITKSDMIKSGRFFSMGLAGLLFALVINIFIKDGIFTLIISLGCIVAFCAVMVWNVSDLEHLEDEAKTDEKLKSKIGIIGALTIYLNFINLVLFVKKIYRFY